MNRDAIGGYLELELPPGNGERYPGAQRFQSARAALLALLAAHPPQRIWMPWYNCETMLEPPAMAGIPVHRYQIDEHFEIAEDIVLGENDWLLYVNYFGVCDAQVERVLSQFPPTQVVIDNSQAFFYPPTACLATLYSPRKFFGIPDGGYLITDLPIPEPEEQDGSSIERLQPLLIRIDKGPEAGYEGIRMARATLRGQRPKRMSTLTQRLLAHIDYAAAFERRKQNFARYHRLLGNANTLTSLDARARAPLCYPFWNHRTDLHAALSEQRIFVAKYWPNTRGRSGTPNDLEFRLSTECLALPCDQRYGESEIDLVIAALREAAA